MKKLCIALNALLLVTFSQQSQSAQGTTDQSLKNDFDAVRRIINNHFASAFMNVDVSTLVKNAVGRQNALNCSMAIEKLNPLIKKYSADYLYRPDTMLMAIESDLEKACISLVTGTLAAGKRLEEKDFGTLRNQLDVLRQVESQMGELVKKLKANSFYLVGKQECNTMLIYTATLIETAAIKAQKDFNNALTK